MPAGAVGLALVQGGSSREPGRTAGCFNPGPTSRTRRTRPNQPPAASRIDCQRSARSSVRIGRGVAREIVMNAVKTKPGADAKVADLGAAAADRAAPRQGPITPAAALTRHVEWLEFALATARSEELWRTGRLDKAPKKSRQKRALRLTEVRDEIAELAALVDAIHQLQARRTRTTGRSPSTTRRTPGTKRRTSAAAAASNTRQAVAATDPTTSPDATGPTDAHGAETAATPPKRARATSARGTRPRPATSTPRRSASSKAGTAAPKTRRRRAAGPSTDGPA